MKLKELRKSKGISQEQAANALGISVRAYQNYEYRQREPNIEMILKLADFYDVSTDCLLGRETSNPFEGMSLDDEDMELFMALAKLPSNIRKCTLQLLFELLREVQKNQD